MEDLGKKRFKSHLRQYEKIPIYVVEYHHEVLPFIYRNIGSKHLPLEGTPIIHFDSHPDLLIDPKLNADTVFNKEELFERISIENWILPGAYTGQFGAVFWVKPFWALQMKDGRRNIKIGKDKTNGCIRLECEEDYFISECIYSKEENLENMREFTLDVCTIEKEQKNWSEIDKVVTDALKNKRFILDIDLDFFSTHNPFKIVYDKADLYNLLKKLYYCESIRNSSDVTALIKKRTRQIDQLERLFNYLEANRQLPKKEGFDAEIYKGVKEVQEKLLENYEGQNIDWELVHLAGCTCDNSELPHYVCNPEELETMFLNFKKFLDLLTEAPTIITVSRSTDDDYTPSEYVEEIQSKVLDILKKRFTCDEPILHYLDIESD